MRKRKELPDTAPQSPYIEEWGAFAEPVAGAGRRRGSVSQADRPERSRRKSVNHGQFDIDVSRLMDNLAQEGGVPEIEGQRRRARRRSSNAELNGLGENFGLRSDFLSLKHDAEERFANNAKRYGYAGLARGF